MQTNIEIDDALLAEAMAATGLKTQRNMVEAGLRLLAGQKGQADAQELFGASAGRAVYTGNAWVSPTSPTVADEGAGRQLRLD